VHSATGGRSGTRSSAVACRNRYARLMECCAPVVLSWSGGSNLANFPLSLADASVDPFPKQVSAAAVAGVLLDHADKHFARRDGVSVSHGPADAEVGEPMTSFSVKATSSRQACQESSTTIGASAQSASAMSSDQYQARQSCPASRASRPRRRHGLSHRRSAPGRRRLLAERSSQGSMHDIPFCTPSADWIEGVVSIQNESSLLLLSSRWTIFSLRDRLGRRRRA